MGETERSWTGSTRQYSTSRRGLLSGAAGGLATGLLAACTPASPRAAAPAGASVSAAPTGYAAADALPSYIPFKGGPAPDYHVDDPRYSDAYDRYPLTPFKAITETPGRGSKVNVLIAAYFPTPTPVDSNPTWQAVNKALNANVSMNVVAGIDYATKFATTVASDDLPDLLHIYFGYSLAPNLPQLLKAKCADLTPYLAGDGAREYPFLANLPTYAWKNSIAAIDGALYLIPIQRHLTSFPPAGGNFFKNGEFYDDEIGANYTPNSADDFKRVLLQLNRPRENRWALGKPNPAASVLFGLPVYGAMFGAPNNWRLDAAGKLIKDIETDEYRAALAYLRELMSLNLFPPDIVTMTSSRQALVARKFVVVPEGHGNSWIDALQQGLQVSPPFSRLDLITPFAAFDNQKPQSFTSPGFISMTAIKKAPPERIRELLRILNFLAAPFGSQEEQLLLYGIEGQDFQRDAAGNPVSTPDGLARSGYVPWRYIAQRPFVHFQPNLPGYAKKAHEAEKAVLPIAIDDPTLGLYAPTAYRAGATAEKTFNDGVAAIILGREPLSSFDGLVRNWQSAAGNQMREEYLEAMNRARP